MGSFFISLTRQSTVWSNLTGGTGLIEVYPGTQLVDFDLGFGAARVGVLLMAGQLQVGSVGGTEKW